MVWPRVKEGRGGNHQEDVKHASARKEKGEAQEKMVGQYQGGHERVQDDGRHGTRSKCVAHEDKGRPIATWRRPLGEKVRSLRTSTDRHDSGVSQVLRPKEPDLISSLENKNKNE